MMDYFYVDPSEVREATLQLRGDEVKHLVRVMRKKAGERIMVMDGRGRMFDCVIRTIEREAVTCDIADVRQDVNEPKVYVTLAVSMLKNPARFDLLVEKATELGVRTIIPLECERTIRHEYKHLRLQRIALAAAKQSGRCYVPEIFVRTSFATLVEAANGFDVRLIPHEQTEQSQFIGTVMRHHLDAAKVLVAVGPEGGFADHELGLASSHGFIPISLGPRRLRTETAALAAVSYVVGGW
jgi:16S rRNA (uracil1498-N3)-methyltransferase